MTLFCWFLLALVLFIPAVSAGSETEHQVRVINENLEATQARFDMLFRAEKIIRIQTFIYGKDDLSLAGLAVMAKRHIENGVRVKLILDAYFNFIPKPVISYLVSIGIEIKHYHPFRLSRPGWIYRRMHDKGYSVDGIEMIRGGRNIESSYFGFSASRNYIDRDLYVKGPEVKKSDEYFDDLFDSAEVADIKVSSDPSTIDQGRRILQKAYTNMQINPTVRLNPALQKPLQTFAVDNLDFIHDPIGKKGQQAGTAEALYDLFSNSQREVIIESPYLVPTQAFIDMVKALKARNPSFNISILTNSHHSTDGVITQGAYIRYRRQLAELGVRIFEYKGPEAIHSKSIVIDDFIAGILSFNLDPRSHYYNTEVGLVSRNTELAAQVKASIQSRMNNSWEIGANGKPLSGETRPALTLKKKALLGAALCASFLMKNQI